MKRKRCLNIGPVLLSLLAGLLVQLGCSDDSGDSSTDGDTSGNGEVLCEDVNGDSLCSDSESDLRWAQPISEQRYNWQAAIDYCEQFSYGGRDDWRLPTISELRSMVRDCDHTATGGECGITDGCLTASCLSNDCSGCSAGRCYWDEALGSDCEIDLWSASEVTDAPTTAWFIGFYSAGLNSNPKESELRVRCVVGESSTPDGDDDTPADGDTGDGDVPDGDASDGDITDGDNVDGDSSDGDAPDGDSVDGDVPDGDSDPDSSATMHCQGTISERVCEDLATGYVWQDPPAETERSFAQAQSYCENLSWNGYDDWCLPTISQLRSLIVNCSETESGGACGVHDACLADTCFDSGDCDGCTAGTGSCYWDEALQGGCNENTWSDSEVSTTNENAWFVGFYAGAINSSSKDSAFLARCMRCLAADGDQDAELPPDGDGELPGDDDLPAPDGDLDADLMELEEEAMQSSMSCTGVPSERACTDANTNLTWQDPTLAATRGFSSAQSYCNTLSWAGFSDWRLPSLTELRSLIRDCSNTESAGACNVRDGCLADTCMNSACEGCDDSQNHCYWDPMLLGGCNDNTWSNSEVNTTTENAWFVGFYAGAIDSDKKDEALSQVRCVRP